MELVKRYIAAVQRQLPEKKQQEIGRELEANIMDQLEALAAEQQRSLTDDDIAVVLKNMGHPQQVAQQFFPPQPLISLHYMPVYRYTLYMVLGILFVLQIIGTTANWLSSDFGLLLYLKGIVSGFINDGCFAFTVITVTFALMSVNGSQTACLQHKNWQPQQLPAAGPGWRHISLQDIFTDLATYAFLLVIIWYPVWLSAEQLADRSVLVTEPVIHLLQWCSPLILAGIGLCLWQLQQRWWSKTMLQLNVVLNLAFVVILLYLAGGPLLQFNIEQWQSSLSIEQLQHVISWGLVITACFPGYEVIRDVRRLWLSR
ncbi:hypothetical protein QE250_09710 [Chromatiaceae bacterium AAb-1]|nr:hypothetical protein [Chromatiaceae bacterium AAb-1]